MICFLDERLEVNPNLSAASLRSHSSKSRWYRPHPSSSLMALFRSSECHDFLAIFDSTEEDLRRIGGPVRASKYRVILEERGGRRTAVCCRHLFQDVDDFHQWIPSREVGVRGELECVINGFVEHIIACSLDVQVREPVVSTKYEISVDLRLGDAIESRDGNICWVARCIKLGISIDIKNGDSCPIIYHLLSGIGR